MWKFPFIEHEKASYLKIKWFKKKNIYITNNRTIQTWNNLPEYAINAKTTKSFESRLDRHWKNQDNMYNYEANLTTGTEIKSDKEDEDLSKVVNDQCSEEDL